MKYFVSILFICFLLLANRIAFAENGFKQDSTDCAHTFIDDWANTIGGDGNDVALDVSADIDGNILVTGYFIDSLSVGDTTIYSMGEKDMFLVKFSIAGDFVWAQCGGGIGNDYGSGVATDSEGNIFVIGTMFDSGTFDGEQHVGFGNKDIFLSKYSALGEILWFNIAGGWDNDEGVDIAIDADDNLIICGNYENSMAIGSQTLITDGGRNFFVAKYSVGEIFSWASNHGSNLDDYSTSLATDMDLNVFVGGNFSGTMSAGSFSMVASGAYDGFIASYTPEGFIRWMVPEGTDADNDILYGLDTDFQGNVFATGYLNQAENTLFVSRYSNTGAFSWRREIGAMALAEGKDIVLALNGDIYIVGQFSGVADFGGGNTGSLGGYDLFTVNLNSNGDYLWGRYGGSANLDGLNAICLDIEQSIVEAGSCHSPIYIEGMPYNGNDLSDGLVIRLQKALSMGAIEISGIDCDENNMCAEINMLAGTSPFSYYWSTGEQVSFVCGLSVGTYTLTVVDDAGCYIDTTINIAAPEIPFIDLPATLEICPFDTVTLSAGEGMQLYTWNTTETTESIVITEAGNYTVTVVNEFGCENSHTVNVSELDAPNLIALDTVYLCNGDAVLVSIIDSYNSYTWSSGQSTQTVNLFNQGLYKVTVYNSQCVYYDTVRLIYYPQPEVNLGGDQYICEGDSIVFDAGEGFDAYLWQNGSSQQTYTLYNEGPVMVTVTDVNACTDNDSVYLSFAENPVVSLGNDTSACANIEILLDPGDTYETYLWNTESTEQIIAPEATGTYSVTVSNLQGCTHSDEVSVTIFPIPDVDLGEDISFCAYSSHLLSTSGSFVNYTWSTGASSPNISVSNSGEYSLTVTDANSCSNSDTVIIDAYTVESPMLADTIVVCDSSIIFISPENEFETYLWSNGSENIGITVSSDGIYRLTVTDENNCTSEASVEVIYAQAPVLSEVYSSAGQLIVEAAGGSPPYLYSIGAVDWQHGSTFMQLSTDFYDVYVIDSLTCTDTITVHVDNLLVVPEFFTPNSDGFNDTWEIGGIYQYPNAQFMIFDRFGKKIIEYKGSQPGWNGIYNGQLAPSDTYWYIIIISKEITLKGPVTLKR